MYDTLTLYYLNQIGIFPWVDKSSQIPMQQIPEVKDRKMMLIIPMNINKKNARLMEQILNYLNVKERNIERVDYNEEILQSLGKKLQNQSVVGVLSLVSDSHFSQHMNPKAKTNFSSIDLGALINHPIRKKQAFIELNRFKDSISSQLNENEV